MKITVTWITYIRLYVSLLSVTPVSNVGKTYDSETYYESHQSHPYTQGLVNIRMSKFSEPPVQGRMVPAIRRNRSNADEFSFNVGGLGLTSSIHSRISLGPLSTAVHNAANYNKVFRAVSPSPVKAEPVTPAWPIASTSNPGFGKLNMRIMGQTIDSQVLNHLHPDVSPYTARKLRKVLGANLDKVWTSESAPRVLRQRGISGGVGQVTDGYTTQSDSKLVDEAHALNFTFRHETGSLFTLPEVKLSLFRSWLIDRATCEMEYIWEDLGPLFWPRWIRRGVCINRPNHSCSWPPGMKCRPSGSRALQLLHWKCEDATHVHSRNEAAEQRNRRRAATNNFQSKFFEMKPVGLEANGPGETPVHSTQSRFGLRDTHGIISLAAHSEHRLPVSPSSADVWRSQQGESPKTGFSNDERRKRRARRMIKRLSVTANGYHCYWQVQKYLISDRCACLCS